jgi:ribose transport system permease protein
MTSEPALVPVGTSDPESPVQDSRAGRRRLGSLLNISEVGVAVPLVLLIAVFTAVKPAFLSQSDIDGILIGASYVGVIAVGQTILMVAGEFDLSVGSTAGLAAVGAAWFMTHGVPPGVGLLLGVLIGVLVGAVNAFTVVKLGIPAFIATLGMLYVAEGVTLMIGGGGTIYPLPSIVGDIGSARVLNLSYSFLAFVALVIVGEIILRKTTFGRAAYATGGNREVARVAGISTGRIKTIAFMVTGGLAAVAGILIMTSVASADSQIGSGYELTVIAGVVVGGVSLFGGTGSVIGAGLGVLLLQVVQSGLVVIGLSANWQTVAVGTIMIVAVGIDVLRRRFRAS